VYVIKITISQNLPITNSKSPYNKMLLLTCVGIIRGIGAAGRRYEISNGAVVKCVPPKSTAQLRSCEIPRSSKFPGWRTVYWRIGGLGD